MLQKKFPLFFIAVLATCMAWPLFEGRIIYLADGPYAFIKTVAMSVAWHHGDFIGRWTPDIIHGLGYPFFNFYSPLFFYISALFMQLSVPAFWAFNLTIYLAVVASGLSMYAFAKEIWGQEGGLLAAVAYLTAPYHIMDLYTRGALAEFLAFVFFPLVLRSVYLLMRQISAREILIGMVSVAGLILSHNISALFFCAVSFAYLIFLYITSSKKHFVHLGAALSVFAGGMLLTMYFWLPALMEKKYVQIERLLSGIYDYHRNFLDLSQMLMPVWPTNTNNYYMIGPIHLILGLLVVLLAWKIGQSLPEESKQIAFFACVFGISVVLVLPQSLYVWQHLPLLAFAEFPWRLLMCATAAISILGGGFIFLFKESLRPRIMWLAMAACILFSLPLWHPWGFQDIPYQAPEEYLRDSLPMDDMEYLPKSVSQIVMNIPGEKLSLVSGQAGIDQGPQHYLDDYYQIHAQTNSILCYHTYNFPGWKVESNALNVPLQDNPWGLIVFAVPPGDVPIRIHFVSTLVRQLAQSVSMAAWIMFGLSVLWVWPIKRLIFKS